MEELRTMESKRCRTASKVHEPKTRPEKVRSCIKYQTPIFLMFNFTGDRIHYN